MTGNSDPKHGEVSRALTLDALSARDQEGGPGKFGRMFPGLIDLNPPSLEQLEILARGMIDPDPTSSEGDLDAVSAGYTYLGQFVDHDITLDLTPATAARADPMSVTNFRTPALDLDSLYGGGLGISPFMYQRSPVGPRHPVIGKLLVGTAAESISIPPLPGAPSVAALPNDLPRNSQGRAIIADERNDENLLVAQTHLLFIKFHNAVYDLLTDQGFPEATRFEEAQRIVRWHYQWIVLFDFVDRLTSPGTIARLREEGRSFYLFKNRPFMPAEFSAAVYRLGHSMVRLAYDHNRFFGTKPPQSPGSLRFMFSFTGKSGFVVGDLASRPVAGANTPGKAFPSNWVIDWRRYYDLGERPPGVDLNLARRLDPQIIPELHTLPGQEGREAMLPFRNLRAGARLQLPSGQDVAEEMEIAPVSADDLVGDQDGASDGAALGAAGLVDRTPLWYYILKEAKVQHGGQRLGAVGSRILSEVFLGLIEGDPNSFLSQRKNWTPELPARISGTFTMLDLIDFVGSRSPSDVNPLGN